MFIELFFIVSDKTNKSKKSEAAKVYDSDSGCDSDKHKVVSTYNTTTTVNNKFVYCYFSMNLCFAG